jgi:C-terminal processing protease CtpA/Prc
MSQLARSYLDRIVAIMEGNANGRLVIDWTAFRSSVYAAAPLAQTIAATYPAIQQALAILQDGHSSYTSKTGVVLRVRNRTCTGSGAFDPVLPKNIGYVRVPAFLGSGQAATDYAGFIQTAIKRADRSDLVGWVVDLRGNTGGSMWPMLAGLGPILGSDTLGYFVDPTGTTSAWAYREGASWDGGYVVQRAPQPYTLIRQRPKVAVLVDNAVGSSGEAAFISFRGRPNTRSFGVATCGLSTGNKAFTLSDGASLNLTFAVMADRSGTPYGDRILPDEISQGQTDPVQRAVAWLQGPSQ